MLRLCTFGLRTDRNDILARDGEDFIVIDATGAIQRRFTPQESDYPVAYTPLEDVSGTCYHVEGRALIECEWAVSDTGCARSNDRVVLADLLPDHDPDPARFVAFVLRALTT